MIFLELVLAYETAYPRECCGFLVGFRHTSGLVVQRILPTLNVVNVVGGFAAIPDIEISRVRLLAEEAGLAIVALFHSHPSGSAELSDGDLAALRYSEWPWVIVTKSSVTGDLLLAFYEADGRRIQMTPE